MAVSVRIEFSLGVAVGDDAAPTVGDVRRWLAAAETAGVDDSETLAIEYTEQGDVVGFFVWGSPSV